MLPDLLLPSLQIGMAADKIKLGTPVTIPPGDRFESVYIVGKPGMGKSTALANFYQKDTLSGFNHCIIIVDPHGQFARDSLRATSKSRFGACHYCSIETPFNLNPFIAPYEQENIAQSITEIIDRTVTATSGNEKMTVNMGNLLKPAIYETLGRPNPDFEKLLETLKGHTESRKNQLTNEEKGSLQRVISRLDYIISSPNVKRILCGTKRPVVFRDFIESGKIFLLDTFRFAKPRQVLIGNVVSQGVKDYFLFTRQKDYPPCVFLLDEFHEYLNSEYIPLVTGGRKFSLSFVMAHQSVDQVPQTLVRVLDTIIGTVGTIIAFRSGANTVKKVGSEFKKLNSSSITHLNKHYCLVKIGNNEYYVMADYPPIPIFPKIKFKDTIEAEINEPEAEVIKEVEIVEEKQKELVKQEEPKKPVEPEKWRWPPWD